MIDLGMARNAVIGGAKAAIVIVVIAVGSLYQAGELHSVLPKEYRHTGEFE
jgi:hypothetical protein